MVDILSRLKNGDTLLADGAIGSMLMTRGMVAGDCPERFNLKQPRVLIEIAAAYAEAGSDIIQTNTFGGSPLKLAQYDLDSKAREINLRGVDAVQKGVGQRAAVFGSCGPCGGMIKPYGEYELDQVQESFMTQMAALVEAGVDGLTIETMVDLSEAVIALKAARSVSETLPVFVTMTFDRTPKGFFTIMGNRIKDAVRDLTAAGANAVGSNCGNGIENMVLIAREFTSGTELPVMIQSNAGLPEIRDGQLYYSETPEFMAGEVRNLLECGVKIIGGCCGTTPEHIKAFRKIVDSY